jgi:hypothetical protein
VLKETELARKEVDLRAKERDLEKREAEIKAFKLKEAELDRREADLQAKEQDLEGREEEVRRKELEIQWQAQAMETRLLEILANDFHRPLKEVEPFHQQEMEGELGPPQKLANIPDNVIILGPADTSKDVLPAGAENTPSTSVVFPLSIDAPKGNQGWLLPILS